MQGLKAWSVYAAPVRLELVEAMRAIAPCSIAEIASALDRPADSLYRHVEKLVKVGIVVDVGTRRKGRRFERVLDLAGDDFRPALPFASPQAVNRAFDVAAQSVAKIIARTSRDATKAGRIEFEERRRNALVKLEHAWLTPAEFARLRAMFVEIKRFMDERKARRKGNLYLSAFAVVPVHRKRSARTASGRVASGAAATPSRVKHATRRRA